MSLEIKNLHASVDGTEILKGLSLNVPAGEVHAIMGPNGSGKSTLAKVMAGHDDYEVSGGEVLLDGQNLLGMEIDERSRAGLFLAFQYPAEIPGVSNANFLRAALQARLPGRRGDRRRGLLQGDVCQDGQPRHRPEVHRALGERGFPLEARRSATRSCR